MSVLTSLTGSSDPETARHARIWVVVAAHKDFRMNSWPPPPSPWNHRLWKPIFSLCFAFCGEINTHSFCFTVRNSKLKTFLYFLQKREIHQETQLTFRLTLQLIPNPGRGKMCLSKSWYKFITGLWRRSPGLLRAFPASFEKEYTLICEFIVGLD